MEFIENIFDSGGFMPRWVCGIWSESLGWLYILSNIAIGLAYFTIPILLFKVISKRKESLFNKVFIYFILFILFCGTTHLIDAFIFWVPVYRLNAVALCATAIISWITVFVLYRFIPKALQYRSPADLQLIIEEQTKELDTAYKKLAISENQFKILVNSNPDVITRIDKNLTYQFINDSIRKVRDIETESIVGKNIRDIGDERDKKANEVFIKNVETVFSTNEPLTFEFENYNKSNLKGYFQLSIIPLENQADGKPDDVLTITRDITHQKLYELELKTNIDNLELLAHRNEKKRKILEDFTYIVSHNLRSPVANLSTLLSLLKVETDRETRSMFLEKIELAFENLSTTVTDLTNVVRIRQETEIPREELFFQNILNKHIINIETQINETSAIIEYDFSECEKINYPKIYLESILLNLLTNAIRYKSPKRKPQIFIKTYIDQDGKPCLTCEDNGLGIDLKKYGEKLFGLNKTFHGHPDAKGTGLFITKNQIETMGGTIYAESQVDVGTKFIILFESDNS